MILLVLKYFAMVPQSNLERYLILKFVNQLKLFKYNAILNEIIN